MQEEKDLMFRTLLGLSTEQYLSDPAFHARCQITNSAVAWSAQQTGDEMTRMMHATAMQAAAVALVLAKVTDEEIMDSVNQEAVAVAMLEFGLAMENMKKAKEAEGE